MTCLFLPPEELTSQPEADQSRSERQITIKGTQAKHLRVLRAKPGELIKIFDGMGHRYITKVVKIYKKEILVEIIKEELYSAESPISIILAQGIPKGDKMDFIVQKATELGIKTIAPIISERSEVKETRKLERWRKIAISASQQSGREKIPHIEESIELKEFLSKNQKGIIFSEEEKNQNLKKVLKDFEGSTTIILLIGPEGGFSPHELALAVRSGFTPASLGPRVLRTETAAITAISIIQYELGDIN